MPRLRLRPGNVRLTVEVPKIQSVLSTAQFDRWAESRAEKSQHIIVIKNK